MSVLTIDLPVQEDQTAFNLQRWDELASDAGLACELAKIEGKIETDRHGHVIMYPPPGFTHGSYQSEIAFQLRTLLPQGRVVTECPISTADGVKAADVVWISKKRLAAIGDKACLTEAPEICVEILSPSNTAKEMEEKKALYFAANAEEVWFCNLSGGMTFHCSGKLRTTSLKCPDFPQQISL